jgi:predicted nucleotidyltransferase
MGCGPACASLWEVSDPRLERALTVIEGHYGARLVAVALFGSRAGGRPRSESDWDLLLVVDEGERIERALYREWDAQIAPVVEAILPAIAPHCVHLPRVGEEPSGLWLEIAMAHEVLRDPTHDLATYLAHVRGLIQAGRFERRAVHGLGYWRRAG